MPKICADNKLGSSFVSIYLFEEMNVPQKTVGFLKPAYACQCSIFFDMNPPHILTLACLHSTINLQC